MGCDPAAAREEDLLSGVDIPEHLAFDLHGAVGLHVAGHDRAAGDDRETDVGAAYLALGGPLLVVPEQSHGQVPSFTSVSGSTTCPRWRSSKCRWGALELPV